MNGADRPESNSGGRNMRDFRELLYDLEAAGQLRVISKPVDIRQTIAEQPLFFADPGERLAGSDFAAAPPGTE